jgi:hypothetical protein
MSQNFFDQGEQEEPFEDKPEEMQGQYDAEGNWHGQQSETPQLQVQRPAQPAPQQGVSPAPKQEPAHVNETEEEVDEDEEDVSATLTDARLRLEMGKLYELIMKHEIFEGADADPKAMKIVQKQIRNYAQEQMEIMLGMRQEPTKAEANSFPMELFPFNSLEVDTLKALAAAATKGASRDAEPLDLTPAAPPAKTTLKPIGSRQGSKPAPKASSKPLQNKPAAPVRRNKADIDRILAEEGLTMADIDQVMDSSGEFLDPERRSKMTEDDIRKRNKEASNRNKRAESKDVRPMPTPEQLEQMYTQRSAVAESSVKGWAELIGMVKNMPPTILQNKGGQ